jgi:hypothetical protein
MSGEAQDSISGWTTDTLQRWVVDQMAAHAKLDDQRFSSQEEMVKAAVRSAKEAVDKAETAANERFKSINEIRGAMLDQTGKFVTRDTVDALVGALNTQITALGKQVERMEGRGSGLQQGWGYIVGAVGLALGLVSLFNLLHK